MQRTATAIFKLNRNTSLTGCEDLVSWAEAFHALRNFGTAQKSQKQLEFWGSQQGRNSSMRIMIPNCPTQKKKKKRDR